MAFDPLRSSAPTQKLAVNVISLSKRFGELQAVDNVTLQLTPGTCFVLLGPNGAGKTTTCELLTGLQTPDQGSIELLGKLLVTHRPEIIENMGVLMQETSLYKKYTVTETLELFASFYHQPVAIPELLQRLHLQEKSRTFLQHLSGGQKQRVYLACALINNPQLLFLDEPTTGLDPQSRRHIWDLLSELKREHRTIVLTTHNMEEAQTLADHIAIMDRGKILASGTYQELRRRFCGEEVLTYHVSASEQALLSHDLQWLASARRNDEDYMIEVNGVEDKLQQLIRFTDRHKIKISALSVRQSTLEDVFLHITGRNLRDGD